MTRADHLAKAERIMAGMAKLVFPQDYLAIVDGALIAGYHYGNALLHLHGVLPETEHANTPSKLETPVERLPAPIQAAFRAFVELEGLRSAYVRSPSDHDPKLDRRVPELLNILRQANAR